MNDQNRQPECCERSRDGLHCATCNRDKSQPWSEPPRLFACLTWFRKGEAIGERSAQTAAQTQGEA